MHIDSIDIAPYRIALQRPLRLAGRDVCEREGFLLKIFSQGALGMGDVAPLPGFSAETLTEARENVLALGLEGADVAVGGLASSAEIPALDNALPSVRFGIECALLELAAKQQLGLDSNPFDRRPRPIAVNALLTEPSVDAFLQLVEQGYTCIKIKVGRDDGSQDMHFLHSLSGQIDPGVSLRLDANRAWSQAEAQAFVEALPALPLMYIEEPCVHVRDSLKLAQTHGVPIALDESLISMDEQDLARLDKVAAFVIKPTLCGGVCAAVRLARAARECGAQPVISAAFESAEGLRALVFLADALMTPAVAAGLDTWQWLGEDISASGVTTDGPTMHVMDRGGSA